MSARTGRGRGRGGAASRGGRKFGANRSTSRTGKGKKNARAVRELRKREPQLVEGEKNLLTMRGPTCSEMMISVLRDLARLRTPCAKRLTRKNPIRPFEAGDVASLEFLADKNECSTFAHATHSKKRPHNLTLGRTFDRHVLDMVEFGVEAYQPTESFPGYARAPGSKPLMIFVGHEFEHDPTMSRVKDLLLDIFRGRPAKEVCLAGIDHLINVTMIDGLISLRTHTVKFKKSGTKVPRVVLEDMGPHLDLTVRRTHFAAPNLAKLARKQAKAAEPKKIKNITKDALGDTVGRVHMLRQDYTNLNTRKLRGLKKRFTPRPEGEADDAAQPSASKKARKA